MLVSLGQTVTIFAHSRYCLGLCIKKFTKKCHDICFSMVSLKILGVSLTLSHPHIGLPQGLNSNFPNSIPITFTWKSLTGSNPKTVLQYNLTQHWASLICNFKIANTCSLINISLIKIRIKSNITSSLQYCHTFKNMFLLTFLARLVCCVHFPCPTTCQCVPDSHQNLC